jgi:hypothetical protein
VLTTHSNQYANRPCCCPTIDASLGVGMVGGVKVTFLALLALVLGVGCGESAEEKAAKAKAAAAKAKAAAAKAKAAAEAKAGAWTSDPSDPNNVTVEAAIRKAVGKPTGKLTKVDLEKVKNLYLQNNQLTDFTALKELTQLTVLYLNDNQLTDVKGLENLTQLTWLELHDNPDLTEAQIDELEKALPNCTIYSDPKK